MTAFSWSCLISFFLFFSTLIFFLLQMRDIEEDYLEDNNNKFWHRKKCSNRALIGPWDMKTPQEPEHLVPNENESSVHSMTSDSNVRLSHGQQ
jgi:hypothetical protein